MFPRLRLSACLLLLAAPLAAATPAVRTFDGLVLPFHEVVVSTPVQGQIEVVLVKEGDIVTAGQPLARLYAKMEDLDMQRTKVALDKKQFDYTGSNNLYADKIISQDEALNRRSELELARLQYEMAVEAVHQRTIEAPIDGLVVEKLREVGETVTAAQPLFRLVDIRQVYVQFFVHAEDLVRLHVGDRLPVHVPVLGDDQVFTGQVDFIDPRVDAASGLMRVKILLANPEGRIKAGLRADVQLKD